MPDRAAAEAELTDMTSRSLLRESRRTMGTPDVSAGELLSRAAEFR